MGWYLEREDTPASRVELVPTSGTIRVEWKQHGAQFDALNGQRTIWQSPPSAPDVTIPPLHFTGPYEVQRLRFLVTSGTTLTLMTDTGESYQVRAMGGMVDEVLDTPDRGTNPKHRVTLTLVGV